MTLDNDRDLRNRFHELISEETRNVPILTTQPDTPASARRPILGLAAAGLTLIAAVTVGLWRDADCSPADWPDVPTLQASWVAPTDFLLDTPGSDLLEGVPRFGESKLKELLIEPAATVPRNNKRTN